MDLIIIWILIAASVTGLTFIVERGLALRRSCVIPREIESALANCRSEADISTLRNACQKNPSPLGRLILLSDNHRNWPKVDNVSALETQARHEVARLERGMVILEIVVGVAPLLGLVGTIYGLILLFSRIGDISSGSSGDISKGIAVALNATLLGLLTAIPSIIAWSYYNKKIENLAVEMATLCDGFMRQLYHIDETPKK